MMTKTEKLAPTSAEINEKIDALDMAMADAEAEFDKLAAEAVAGVAEASKKAAEVNGRISRMHVDRRILARALAKARSQEAAAYEAEQEAERAKHMAAARENAGKLLDAAQCVDDAITALLNALDDLGRIEGETRTAVRAAGAMPNDSIIGRNNIVGHALDVLRRRQKPDARNPWSRDRVADVARVGWRFLLDDENEREVA